MMTTIAIVMRAAIFGSTSAINMPPPGADAARRLSNSDADDAARGSTDAERSGSRSVSCAGSANSSLTTPHGGSRSADGMTDHVLAARTR